MKICRFLPLLVLACAVPARAIANNDNGNVLLIEARVEAVSDFEAPPPPQGNYSYVGGKFRAKISVSKVLIGTIDAKNLTLVMRIASWPTIPFDTYALVEVKPGQELQVAWWDRVGNGLCLGRGTRQQYDIENAFDKLVRDSPKLKCTR